MIKLGELLYMMSGRTYVKITFGGHHEPMLEGRVSSPEVSDFMDEYWDREVTYIDVANNVIRIDFTS